MATGRNYSNYITIMEEKDKNSMQDLDMLSKMILDTWRMYQARLTNYLKLICL